MERPRGSPVLDFCQVMVQFELRDVAVSGSEPFFNVQRKVDRSQEHTVRLSSIMFCFGLPVKDTGVEIRFC